MVLNVLGLNQITSVVTPSVTLISNHGGDFLGRQLSAESGHGCATVDQHVDVLIKVFFIGGKIATRERQADAALAGVAMADGAGACVRPLTQSPRLPDVCVLCLIPL